MAAELILVLPDVFVLRELECTDDPIMPRHGGSLDDRSLTLVSLH